MSKDLPQSNPSDEVDLGQLFKLIGNMFDRFFKFIGNLFNKLFLAFVWFIFFVKTHVIKLIIAGAIGGGVGVLLEKTSEPIYKSSITVKQNYNTGENLYNTISYYNDLVSQKDVVTLEDVLGTENNVVSSILKFEIESVINDNQKLKAYDTYIKTLDSAVASTVEYKTFLNNDEDYNHQYQQISIKSKERKSFKLVFDKIIERINSNQYFKREQNKDLKELKEQVLAIEKALVKSDTLLTVYQKAIIKSAENNNDFQAKITIDNQENTSSTKEFELYTKDIQLRQQLVEIERKIANKEYIVEITSSKQDSGAIDNKVKVLGKLISPKLFYALAFTTLLFIILLGLNFVKFLERYKDKA